jgi:hypothetical protein
LRQNTVEACKGDSSSEYEAIIQLKDNDESPNVTWASKSARVIVLIVRKRKKII